MGHIAAELKNQGFAVTPDFLPRDFVARVRADLLTVREAGRFTRATVGKERLLADEVRRDEIFWLHSETANSVQTELLASMERLMACLNRGCFLGLRSFEGHYAYYPAGGFYQKHVDKFRNAGDREVSVVLYLNEAWAPADGGQLRLYVDEKPFKVEPRAGTLVCFLSAEIEHEVLESRAPRLSFTGWFKT